jgi:hypothetical protein
MRNSVRRAGKLVSFSVLSPLWMSTAQFTASTTLANSARTQSPADLNLAVVIRDRHFRAFPSEQQRCRLSDS